MESSVPFLKIILADSFILYTKTLNFHWNVKGPYFPQLHILFETQYKALQEDIDTVAERLRALNVAAPGTLKEFLSLTQLEEGAGTLKAMEMVNELMVDRIKISSYIKKALETIDENDSSTSNMLEDILETHEEQVWMLRAICEQ